MDAPNVNEQIKEQLAQAYEKFDLDFLLGGGKIATPPETEKTADKLDQQKGNQKASRKTYDELVTRQ